jgi:hypothetical protein
MSARAAQTRKTGPGTKEPGLEQKTIRARNKRAGTSWAANRGPVKKSFSEAEVRGREGGGPDYLAQYSSTKWAIGDGQGFEDEQG